MKNKAKPKQQTDNTIETKESKYTPWTVEQTVDFILKKYKKMSKKNCG